MMKERIIAVLWPSFPQAFFLPGVKVQLEATGEVFATSEATGEVFAASETTTSPEES